MHGEQLLLPLWCCHGDARGASVLLQTLGCSAGAFVLSPLCGSRREDVRRKVKGEGKEELKSLGILST